MVFVQQLWAFSSSEENKRRTPKDDGKRPLEWPTGTLKYALGFEHVVSHVIKS